MNFTPIAEKANAKNEIIISDNNSDTVVEPEMLVKSVRLKNVRKSLSVLFIKITP